MKRFWWACLAAGTMMGAAWAAHAGKTDAVQWIETETFATLPDGVRYPEGLTADPATGAIYAATFDQGAPNKLMRFDRNGKLQATKDFGSQILLGLGFNAGKVYILNMGASKVQRIAANFDASTPVEDVAQVPSIGTPGTRTVANPDGSADSILYGSSGFPAPNALVFDHANNLYFSDSFQGAIFLIANATTCSTPCAVATLKHDPLLATSGFPPFGANGLAFNADESVMYIANTGDNRILAMSMAGTNPITVFAESVHGADGLLFDGTLLWACANQGDQVVAFDAKGKPVARAGEFDGIAPNGTPRGLLFPASLVQVGNWMYVTNLALPLTPAVGDEPEEDVTRWTISRFHVRK
jgi:sugar lactone lactonase YvrE